MTIAATSTPKDILVLWDLENCRLPLTNSGIDYSLRRLNGVVRSFGTPKVFRAYISTDAYRLSETTRFEIEKLNSFEIDVRCCRRYGQLEAVDRAMMVDAAVYVRRYRQSRDVTVILITGDCDFSVLITKILSYGIPVVSIPHISAHPILYNPQLAGPGRPIAGPIGIRKLHPSRATNNLPTVARAKTIRVDEGCEVTRGSEMDPGSSSREESAPFTSRKTLLQRLGLPDVASAEGGTTGRKRNRPSSPGSSRNFTPRAPQAATEPPSKRAKLQEALRQELNGPGIIANYAIPAHSAIVLAERTAPSKRDGSIAALKALSVRMDALEKELGLVEPRTKIVDMRSIIKSIGVRIEAGERQLEIVKTRLHVATSANLPNRPVAPTFVDPRFGLVPPQYTRRLPVATTN